jgi:hypothetical protein
MLNEDGLRLSVRLITGILHESGKLFCKLSSDILFQPGPGGSGGTGGGQIKFRYTLSTQSFTATIRINYQIDQDRLNKRSGSML